MTFIPWDGSSNAAKERTLTFSKEKCDGQKNTKIIHSFDRRT